VSAEQSYPDLDNLLQGETLFGNFTVQTVDF